MNKSKLTPAVAKILKTTLDFININLISNIELEYVRLSASNVIDKLKLTADILADNNPDNQIQLKLVWGNFFADAEIIESVRLALLDAVSKIDDPIIKEGLSLLVEPITQTLSAVSDQNTQDGKQLEKIWVDFLRSEKFVDFVQKNLKLILSKFVKNELIVELVVSLLDLFVKED